jgi:hypothetical protein
MLQPSAMDNVVVILEPETKNLTDDNHDKDHLNHVDQDSEDISKSHLAREY